jgi:hypothetical protein
MTDGHLTDNELIERVELVRKLGSASAAARALGINESSVRRSLVTATRRNLDGEWLGPVLPEGYEMGKVTRHYKKDGSVEQEWQRQHPTIEAVREMCDELIEKMSVAITPIQEISLQSPTTANWLTLYPIVDVHFGQLSWGKETGADYDLKIAQEQYKATVSKLMLCSPNSYACLIEALGDFYHADNDDAETHRSHNHLDVDGRNDKVQYLGTELLIWHIDMALAKHEIVYVHISRGNHDDMSAKSLARSLYFRYQNNPRVIIDRTPKELWVFTWGKVMLGFTHGDRIKAADMPGKMAALYPEIWGVTMHRFAYSGHYHKAKKGPLGDEMNGVEWEILPAFTEKDSFNASMGHSSKRELRSITFDAEEGRLFSTFVNVIR